MAARRQIVLETTATRDRAEALLRSLLDYKHRSEKSLPRKVKPVVAARGEGTAPHVGPKTALDSAIASTQRMIEALNRVILQTNRDLTDEDLEMLEEIQS
jgi:hypothetical protein